MIDDSYLLHAGSYDPQKRREYYLRTRKLKGRHRGLGTVGTGGRPPAPVKKAPPKPHYAEQVAALEKRLKRLKEVLSHLVEDAKKRSGAETNTKPSTSKTAASKSKGGSSKVTPTERKKAAKASAEYRKKHPEKKTPKEEVAALEKQIADIRKKIRKALEDARKQRRQPATKTASKGR